MYTGSEDSENKTASVECECLQAWIQDRIFTEGKFQNELGGKKKESEFKLFVSSLTY